MDGILENIKNGVKIQHEVTFDIESMAYLFITVALLIILNAFVTAKLK